jgi:signal transduction histidine kinase
LDVGPAHFLAEMGFVLATSIVLIVAQAVVVALILLSLARLRRRQDEQVAFMNTVAHEFQTPLFSIALASAVLARASSVAEDGELSRQISVIRRAKERLIEKTKRLLDVAADRSTPLVLAPQRLADLVSAAVAAVDELRDVVGATITVEGDERDASVMVHAPLIEQAITNLLENGLKYGGSPAHIIVRTRAIDSMAVVTVEDNGPGIPVQLWERVFQPFFRAANPAVQDVSGFGLGLSQVHDVARQHGGSITVSRSPIGGALFSLTLPLAVSGNSP